MDGHEGHRQQPGEANAEADAALVRAVYSQHGQALLGYVTRLLGDRGRAEDIVQETVLRAWRHAEQLAADARPLRPWLYTVAAHLVTDAQRARGARPIEMPAGEDTLPGGAGADELDRAVQSWQVTEALATLSPRHRACCWKPTTGVARSPRPPPNWACLQAP